MGDKGPKRLLKVKKDFCSTPEGWKVDFFACGGFYRKSWEDAKKDE